MPLHVDRGGTFTDVITTRDGVAHLEKIRSDRAVIGRLGSGPLTFGTTVATNALLERTGVPTLLLITEGFADLPWIGDMSRPALFTPETCWPAPLCTRVQEVGGRLAHDGTEQSPVQIPSLDLQGIEAVAIVLVNSHRCGTHEQAVAEAVKGMRPDLHIVMGHEVSPELGYLSRIETTLVDAAITPVLSASLRRDAIPAHARAIRSDGSLVQAPSLRAPDAVLSGPAGGVLAVAHIAERAGFAHAVGLDMGGTSTDVCRLDVGNLPRVEGDVRVAGVRLRRPMLEVHTIAAGGGSICWSDGLQLGVGPQSAGAMPGPQCYGNGGPPTLTDAALSAGLVDPTAFSPPLDPNAVLLPGKPAAFLAIARDAMADAVRVLATQRGIDLDNHALVAYGGAAGQHAAEVAARLGITTVLFHPLASGLSAFGQALARSEETAMRSLWCPLTDWDRIDAAWTDLEASLAGRMTGTVHRTLTVRHRGTDHGIAVSGATPVAIADAFHHAHLTRFGFRRDQPLEVVDARIRIVDAAAAVPRTAIRFDLPHPRMGPFLFSAHGTSIVVPAGWRASVHEGLLHLTHVEAIPRPVDETTRTPLGVTLWGNRFMAIAEQSGAVLQRLARSVNIRERLDFSCAVFDSRGCLVANAPHIPVHLGAMGATVRDLLEHTEVQPGQSYLCNDPEAGGSHLPDLTVITAIRHGNRIFFVGSRGHHVDVGGLTPGSMPPHSRRLCEEGFVVRHRPLLEEGSLADLSDLLTECRAPQTVTADLEAQIAANRHAADLLRKAGSPETLAAWMGHLQDVAREAVRPLLTLSGTAQDTIDGIPLAVRLLPDATGLTVDFTGTGGPHPGNLNAPPAVVRAAVLYTLRVLVAAPIPLNEGALTDVRIVLPPRSLLDPPTGAAIVGGNVETSQRLVDLLLRAAGRLASSQGTMNNLTLGGADWAFYETIGGGQGAGSEGAGPWGRQVHMTNTRATDPEVLEARLPLRLWRCERRRGSGGMGTHRGGDGLIREIEVLTPTTAALLATRREAGAPGLGGEPGAPGAQFLWRDGAWNSWDGSRADLDAGERVRVETPGGGGFHPR